MSIINIEVARERAGKIRCFKNIFFVNACSTIGIRGSATIEPSEVYISTVSAAIFSITVLATVSISSSSPQSLSCAER